jgi:putative FmdB family regulatory protein
MPIYEYQCQQCGVFEATQRIFDPALKKCPTCGHPVKRVVSRTSFILKGSGWYATDYARAANKGPAGKAERKTADGSTAAGDAGAAPKGDSAKASGGEAGAGASETKRGAKGAT